MVGLCYWIQTLGDRTSLVDNSTLSTVQIEKIAKRIASKQRLLFIDEFQVEDVSDAMIIGKLLNLLSKMNVFIMLTSNAKMENLYKNGLQRDKFIRHISKLEESFVGYEFIGDKDYRLKNINQFKYYIYSLKFLCYTFFIIEI